MSSTIPEVTYSYSPTLNAFVAPSRANLTINPPSSGGPNRPVGANIVPYENTTGSNLSAAIDSVGTTKEVSFGTGTFEFQDFALANVYGILVQQSTIRGSGVDYTTFQMTPDTSTKASSVPDSNPPTSNGQTNPLRLMRIGSSTYTNPRHISGFTLRGTHQPSNTLPGGHLYHGMMLYIVSGGTVMEDVKVIGIPGNLSREPGETFSVEVYKAAGTSANPVQLNRVEIDGRDSNGTQVAASGFGINFGDSISLTDCNSHHMKYAHGYASYTTSNLSFLRCSATNTQGNGFNFENVSGTVTMRGCTMAANGGYHIAIATNTGSATYNIYDPIYDGTKFEIRATGYNGGARTQDLNAIHLFVDGTERPDLIQWIYT